MRSRAIELFPSFLETEIGSFELNPFGNCFLALLVNIAYRIGPRGNPQIRRGILSMPFAACLNFAFKNNLIGKIVRLCGEIGRKKDRIHIMKKSAKELIKRYVTFELL